MFFPFIQKYYPTYLYLNTLFLNTYRYKSTTNKNRTEYTYSKSIPTNPFKNEFKICKIVIAKTPKYQDFKVVLNIMFTKFQAFTYTKRRMYEIIGHRATQI